mgnify:CR=1 FL=1
MEKCIYCKAEFKPIKYKDFSQHYCPNCGRLLPSKKELKAKTDAEIEKLKSAPPTGKIFVNREEATTQVKAYNDMIRSGYAPAGKQIITEKEYETLTHTSELYDYWEGKKKTVYNYKKHYMWECYLFSILFCVAMLVGGIYLFGWLIPKYLKPSETIEVVVDSETGKYGIYNNEIDSLITPYLYDTIRHVVGYREDNIYRNFYYVKKDGKFGVADSTGRITIDCELDKTVGTYSGLIQLYKGEKVGLMDLKGKQILPPEYKYVLWQNEPLNTNTTAGTYVGDIIPVKANGSRGWELYNRNGEKINKKFYRSVLQTGEPTLVKVQEWSSYKDGIVNSLGVQVVPCSYYTIMKFNNGRAWAKKSRNGAWSLITAQGEQLMTLPKGYEPYPFSEGFAAVKYKNKIGYYDVSGKCIIPHDKYEEIEQVPTKPGVAKSTILPYFHNGKAKVSYNGEEGYIDINGNFTASETLNSSH